MPARRETSSTVMSPRGRSVRSWSPMPMSWRRRSAAGRRLPPGGVYAPGWPGCWGVVGLTCTCSGMVSDLAVVSAAGHTARLSMSRFAAGIDLGL